MRVSLQQTYGEGKVAQLQSGDALPFTPTTTAPVPVVFFQKQTLLDRSLGEYTLESKLAFLV